MSVALMALMEWTGYSAAAGQQAVSVQQATMKLGEPHPQSNCEIFMGEILGDV